MIEKKCRSSLKIWCSLKKTKNYSLEEGVHKMSEWAKKVGAKSTPKFENIEIEDGLPPIWKSQ